MPGELKTKKGPFSSKTIKTAGVFNPGRNLFPLSGSQSGDVPPSVANTYSQAVLVKIK
jgi:hypothetical protein